MLARKHYSQYGHSAKQTQPKESVARSSSYALHRLTRMLRSNRTNSNKVMPITPMPNQTAETRIRRVKENTASCVGKPCQRTKIVAPICNNNCNVIQTFGACESSTITEHKKHKCTQNDPIAEVRSLGVV